MPTSSMPVTHQKSLLLQIPQEEWQRANEYFEAHKNDVLLVVKYRSKYAGMSPEAIIEAKDRKKAAIAARQPDDPNKAPTYSFLKIGDQVYATIDGQAIGEGHFGRVKLIQNQDGISFAVKIEGRGIRREEDVEYQIMKLLEFLHGQTSVLLERQKLYKGFLTYEKLYTVMRLVEGETLSKHMYVPIIDPTTGEIHSKEVNNETKLIYAIKASQAIAELHKLRIIHGDVKAENLMANKEEQLIVVMAIDFGLSMILKEGIDRILLTQRRGDWQYAAPEIVNQTNGMSIYSFASDIYSLGVMFKNRMRLFVDDVNLLFAAEFYEHLLSPNPLERTDMTELLKILYAQLEKQSPLSPQAQQMLDEYRKAESEKQQAMSMNEPEIQPEHPCVAWMNEKTNHCWKTGLNYDAKVVDKVISGWMNEAEARHMLAFCERYDSTARLEQSDHIRDAWHVVLHVSKIQEAQGIPESERLRIPVPTETLAIEPGRREVRPVVFYTREPSTPVSEATPAIQAQERMPVVFYTGKPSTPVSEAMPATPAQERMPVVFHTGKPSTPVSEVTLAAPAQEDRLLGDPSQGKFYDSTEGSPEKSQPFKKHPVVFQYAQKADPPNKSEHPCVVWIKEKIKHAWETELDNKIISEWMDKKAANNMLKKCKVYDSTALLEESRDGYRVVLQIPKIEEAMKVEIAATPADPNFTP